MMKTHTISDTPQERLQRGAAMLKELYAVLAEPATQEFMSRMSDEDRIIIDNFYDRLSDHRHLILKRDGIYLFNKNFVVGSERDNGHHTETFSKFPDVEKCSRFVLELIAVRDITAEKLKKIIEQSINGNKRENAWSQLQHPPRDEARGSVFPSGYVNLVNKTHSGTLPLEYTFDRLRLRNTVKEISSILPDFPLRNPEYFDQVTYRDFSAKEFFDRALKLGNAFYLKDPESICSYRVLKVEVEGGSYTFSNPRGVKKYRYESIEDAVKVVERLGWSSILAEAAIPGLKYLAVAVLKNSALWDSAFAQRAIPGFEKTIELRLLLNSDHAIVGHYIKNIPSFLCLKERGLDTATVLTSALERSGLGSQLAKSVATDSLNKLADSIAILREWHIEIKNMPPHLYSLASVDVIPVYNREKQTIEWFLLESDAPNERSNSRIGISGLWDASPTMFHLADSYSNTWHPWRR